MRGWNWGEVVFRGNTMAFMVDDKPAFEINLSAVSNASPHQKTEAVIEFSNVRCTFVPPLMLTVPPDHHRGNIASHRVYAVCGLRRSRHWRYPLVVEI